jgi:hypothetical protein
MKTFRILIISAAAAMTLTAFAQQSELEKYHRSSLYSVMLKHPEKEFSAEMIEAFRNIPIPDKYNDHNLKLTVFPSPVLQKLSKEEMEGAFKDAITRLLDRNLIARRMVEKWFDRDAKTGAMDMNLVMERGLYDASILDVRKARLSARGTAMLADAGEELLNHTYVLVNDIRYADKEVQKSIVGGALMAVQMVGTFAPLGGDVANLVEATGNVTSRVQGFKVLVTSYLYKLEWNEDIANTFYNTMWMDSASADAALKKAFEDDRSLFRLKYIGSATVYSGKTALGGVKSEKDMFLKVCTRAVDRSVLELQRSFDEFKVNTPLISTEPIYAYIGMKEGVNKDSRYEVLERIMTAEGRTEYKKVGVIKPVEGKIWDNRFMAADDLTEGSDLQYTTFTKVSGGNFYPGMLIRECK